MKEKKYKFITIKQVEGDEYNGKPFYEIVNNKSGDELGTIYYYKPWRQYCFTQEPLTVFSKDCLKDVIDFIESI